MPGQEHQQGAPDMELGNTQALFAILLVFTAILLWNGVFLMLSVLLMACIVVFRFKPVYQLWAACAAAAVNSVLIFFLLSDFPRLFRMTGIEQGRIIRSFNPEALFWLPLTALAFLSLFFALRAASKLWRQSQT